MFTIGSKVVIDDINTIITDCNNIRKGRELGLGFAYSPMIEFSKNKLQSIRNKFSQREVKYTKLEAEEMIKLFNQAVTEVNNLQPSPDLKTLSLEEIKTIQDYYPEFQKLSQVEQDFILNLVASPKNVGHLIGDSFILGMVDSLGIPVEGNVLSVVVKLVLNALEYLPTKYPEKYEGKEAEISHAKAILSQLSETLEHLEHILFAENRSQKEQLFKDFVGNVQKQLAGLKENETLLLPWGWDDPFLGSGHTMLMSITRKNGDLFIEVINTGTGILFHDVIGKETPLSPFHQNTICHYNIPASDEEVFYQKTLSALFEPRIVGNTCGIDDPMYYNTPYSSQELYLMLANYRLHPHDKRIQTEVIKAEQEAGTCVCKCMFAFLGKIMSDNFHKEIKFQIEQEAETTMLKYKEYFLARDPLYEIFLNRLNPNLFRHLDKLQKQGLSETEGQLLLEKFEREKQEIEALTIKPLEINPTLSARFSPQWAGASLGNICQNQKVEFLKKSDLLTKANEQQKVGESGLIPDRIFNQKSFKTIFQDEHVLSENKGDYHLVKHSGVTYKLWDFGDSLTIEREMNGKRHILVTLDDLNMNFIPGSQDWQLWSNVEGQTNELIILDKTTHKLLGIINENGSVQLDGPPQAQYQYATVSPWRHPLIDASEKFLWTKKIDSEGKISEEFQLDFIDENAVELSFVKIDDKWCLKSDPRFFIADEQKLQNLQLHKQYLILQNQRGFKLAIVLDLPNSLLSNKEFREIYLAHKHDSVNYLTITLDKKNKPAFHYTSYQNSFTAYHLMMQAKNPQDYLTAFEFLQASRANRPYNDKELKILGLIAYSNMEKQKDDPEVSALRLYAAYLIHINLINYPSIGLEHDAYAVPSVPSIMDSKTKWAEYLRFTLKHDLSFTNLYPIARSYLRKRNNIPAKLKLEKNISSDDLKMWGFSEALVNPLDKPKLHKIKFTLCTHFNIDHPPDLTSPSSESPVFITRLDKNFHCEKGSYFSYYFKLACSSKAEDRKQVADFLNHVQFEGNVINQSLCSILIAALEANKEASPVNHEAKELIAAFEKYANKTESRSIEDWQRLEGNLSYAYDEFKRQYESNDIISDTNVFWYF